MQKRTVGIIGCGKISQTRHIPEYAANEQVIIGGFYDRNQARSQAMVQQYGGRAYASIQEMLADTTIQAVSICVANAQHAELAIEALRQGKDVLCEKPMATTLADCQAMVAVAHQTGRRLMIDQNQRLAPAHQLAKQLLSQNVIGNVLTFKTTFGHGGPETWSVDAGRDTWFFDKANSKYGAVFDLGIHKVDIMQYILADTFVTAYAKLVTRDKRHNNGELIAVDDNAMAILTTKQGAIGTLAASWTYYGEEDNSTILYGSKGIMKIYDDPQYSLKVLLKTGEKVNYEVDQIQTNDNQTNSGVIDEFIAALQEDRPSKLDATSVLGAMETVFACIESSQSNQVVTIEGGTH